MKLISTALNTALEKDDIVERDYIILSGTTDRIYLWFKLYDDCYKDGNIVQNFIMKRLEFDYEDNDVNFFKKEFKAYKEYKLEDGTWEAINYGSFIVADVSESDTKESVKITAYDYALKFANEYKTDLNYGSVTLLDVLQECCTKCGVELATTIFANSDFVVDSNQFENSAQFGNVVSAVAGASGSFAKIINDKLEIRFINETNIIIDLSDYEEFEDKRDSHPITVVGFGMSNIEGENVVLKWQEGIEQYGENYLMINDNPFAYTRSKREQLITAVFNKLKGFNYSAMVLKNCLYPELECGDLVKVRNKAGELIDTIILRTSFEGVICNLEAPSITKANVEYSNVLSAFSIAKRTEIIVNKQEKTITQIVQEQDEYDSKLTEVEQDVDSIKQKVENLLDFTRTQSAKGLLHLNDCNTGIEYIQELSIRDVKYLAPSDTLTSNEYLVPFGDFFTIVVDKTDRTNKSDESFELQISLEKSLLRLDDNIYDEVNVDKNGEIKLIRRVKYENSVWSKLETEQVEILGTTALPTFEPDTYIYIKENYNINLYASWIIKNEFDEKYATKLELSSSITQTSTEILSEVNKKVDEEEFGTKIEQNAEAIKYAWNQISQYLQMQGLDGKATLNIYAENNNMLMSLNQDGQEFYDTFGNKIGGIGVVRENNKDTLAFIMDVDWENVSETKSMAWGYKDKNGNFLPIFHLVGYYGKESSEYGGNIEVVGDIITNKKIGNDQSYIVFDAVNLDLKFPEYFKVHNDIVDLQMYADAYSNLQAHLKCNGTNIFRLYQNNSFENVINLDDTKFFAGNIPWSEDISAFSGSPNSHLVANFKGGGTVLLYAESSDKRLKKNIKNAKTNALDTINRIKHRQYDWKRDNAHENVGYIAQELEKIDERLIRKTSITVDGKKDYDYQINTLNVLATATKAIQELNSKIEKQQEEINLLKEEAIKWKK